MQTAIMVIETKRNASYVVETRLAAETLAKVMTRLSKRNHVTLVKD